MTSGDVEDVVGRRGPGVETTQNHLPARVLIVIIVKTTSLPAGFMAPTQLRPASGKPAITTKIATQVNEAAAVHGDYQGLTPGKNLWITQVWRPHAGTIWPLKE